MRLQKGAASAISAELRSRGEKCKSDENVPWISYLSIMASS